MGTKPQGRVPIPIKLKRNRRTTFTVKAGGSVSIVPGSTDGKPAVFVELPADATIDHETLTPPRDKP